MASTSTRLFGLIGFPLSHSFSQAYFSEKFRREGIAACKYELFPLKNIEELPALLERHPNLEGLNVTIPYKEKVLPFLHEIDAEAEKTGAVNVLKIQNGKLKGYNSDIYGFEKSLLEFLPPHLTPYPSHPLIPLKALVLGTGGGAKAVSYVLDKLGIPFQFVSRSARPGALTYEELSAEIIAAHHLIINTTPLGMNPNLEQVPPLNYSFAGENHFFYDLIYNPEKTLFLKKAEARYASICNGLHMLHLQAERAWDIWNLEN